RLMVWRAKIDSRGRATEARAPARLIRLRARFAGEALGDKNDAPDDASGTQVIKRCRGLLEWPFGNRRRSYIPGAHEFDEFTRLVQRAGRGAFDRHSLQGNHANRVRQAPTGKAGNHDLASLGQPASGKI